MCRVVLAFVGAVFAGHNSLPEAAALVETLKTACSWGLRSADAKLCFAVAVALGVVFGGLAFFKFRGNWLGKPRYIHQIVTGDFSPDAALIAAMVVLALNFSILMFAFQQMW